MLLISGAGGCGVVVRYQQLLSDCHQCYFQQRLTLLSASVSAAINDLVSRHRRDHCALVSSVAHLLLLFAGCHHVVFQPLTLSHCCC